MVELIAEPFDSGLWKKRVSRLVIGSALPTTQKLRLALDTDRSDIIYCTTPCSFPMMEVLETTGFHLMTIRNTYALSKDARIEQRLLTNAFRLCSPSDFVASDQEIQEMAIVLSDTSRYHHDRLIPPKDALDLYVTWIRNSLYHGYASDSFLILHEGHLVGLVTLKVKDGRGSIDLIGVLPVHQGSGLGSYLLCQAIRTFQASGIQDIVVVTEGENIQANAFYQRKGFVLQDVALVYHTHPTYA